MCKIPENFVLGESVDVRLLRQFVGPKITIPH